MALPPTVPTSFVPKQPVQTTRRAARAGANVFMLIAMIIMVLAIIGAGVTFGYEKVLESMRDKKAQELAAAEASISRAAIDEFLRLHNRLNSTESLLNQHVALSQYLDVLEALTLTTVSFNALDLQVEGDRGATLTMDGTARSFNALAAQSAAFAAEKRIKRAIFSDIKVGAAGGITFSLTAELDPSLVIWTGTPMAAPLTETATTTAPQL